MTYQHYREENGRKRVKTLQKQLQDIKKEKEKEIQERNEMIAHLKVIYRILLFSLSCQSFMLLWNFWDPRAPDVTESRVLFISLGIPGEYVTLHHQIPATNPFLCLIFLSRGSFNSPFVILGCIPYSRLIWHLLILWW